MHASVLKAVQPWLRGGYLDGSGGGDPADNRHGTLHRVKNPPTALNNPPLQFHTWRHSPYRRLRGQAPYQSDENPRIAASFRARFLAALGMTNFRKVFQQNSRRTGTRARESLADLASHSSDTSVPDLDFLKLFSPGDRLSTRPPHANHPALNRSPVISLFSKNDLNSSQSQKSMEERCI
ncbi:MAG TPA: hypothetical protein VG206_05910 [Terriglobia bacterium]|nr:hypothetical protein [Terriglobia bacterium]